MKQNNINFKSEKEFFEFIDIFKSLKFLEIISIDVNPFTNTYQDYEVYFIFELKDQLKKLNDQEIN